MLVIQLNNNHLAVLDTLELQDLYTCIQELQLWQGEDPMDADAGVDYFSIFNNRKFIELEIQRVLDHHKDAYISCNIEKIDYVDDVLKIDIIFNISADKAFRFNLHVNKALI